MKDAPLIIGTRGSELALSQTELVERGLKAKRPDVACQRQIIHTLGDRRTDIPLPEVAGASGTVDKGVFVAAIQEALIAGEIDCAVHSLKDLPGQMDDRLEIAATLPRADIHDVLILKEGADIDNLLLGTSSVRRRALARAYWGATARTRDIRGNVPTRLRKLAEDRELSGIILAKAGLERLGYISPEIEIDGVKLVSVDLPRDSFTPAVGQGTIAVQIRKGDKRASDIVSCLDDPITHLCSRTEREFLRLLGADCSTPVGAYARIIKETITFRVLHIGADGVPRRVVARGPVSDPEGVAALAIKLLLEFKADYEHYLQSSGF